MEENKLDLVKLILENDLNKNTIKRLLQIIREITDNVFNNIDNTKIIEIMGNDMETLKDYYKNVIDSISDLQE